MNPGKFLTHLFAKSQLPVRWQSREFLLGANLPWVNYGCDFGANAWWPKGGVSNHQETLTNHFRALSETDVRIVRWFMLCDGRAGLDLGPSDISLDPFVFADIDAALRIAGQFGIQIMFILFDFHWFFPAQLQGNVQTGGRSKYMTNWFLRRHLLQNVVRPILQRYGHHSSIHSWDVFNEPEWIIEDIAASKTIPSISLATFRGLLKDVVDLIHQETAQPATMGLAQRSSLNFFNDCSLDFYQVHWYDKQVDELWTPVESPIPVVLGEFPTAGSLLPVAEILRQAQKAGFAGAFAWSVKDNVTLSSLSSLISGLTEFRKEPLAR